MPHMGTRGMSIDSMRIGGGRCPPLLVGILVFACIMMVCNWWTLSSANLELLRQIDELNEQIKISVEERDQCMTQRETIEKNLKVSLDDARTTHVKLSQVEDTMTTCNQELKSIQLMDVSKTATLEALRMDKDTISARLNTKVEDNKKLEDELHKVKDELEQTKLLINALRQKQVPVLPIAKLVDNSDNKSAHLVANAANIVNDNTINIGENTALNLQMKAPPNVNNIDPQEQDAIEKDNNAAEVHDVVNPADPDENFLRSEVKVQNTNTK